MASLQVSLFGGFACRSLTGEAINFPTRKVRALVAYLAANALQAQRRDKLAGLLWGEHSEAEARSNLRKALSRLRQSLPEAARDCVIADASDVALRTDLLEIDSLLFEQLVADGTPDTLERAVVLHRGPFLDGFSDCGEEFEAWLVAERRRLEELHHQALQRLLDHCVVTGAIDRAIQIALQLLALDPLQESVHRTLLRLYMYQDRVGAALDQYERCRELLAQELGVEPAEETERLRAELLRLVPPESAPARETDDLPERARLLQAATIERRRRRGELAGGPSIAVLSFAGTENDDAHRHLGDGMAEDIATELGRFREIEVIAPSTALAYRAAAVPPERVMLLRAAMIEPRRRRGELAGGPSIAVLSFAGTENDEAHRHLGDGMAEDIATELGRFREIEVIAPSTALAYRAAAVPPERIGAELGTAYVLEGRLRTSGPRLRITARLVETESARQLWAERYDCARDELFDAQDEVTRRIVGTLVGRIEGARLEAAGQRRRPDDLEAYDLWLRGWHALKRPDPAAIGEARRLFQQAVARDPRFSGAYVGLAMAHLNEWACFSWNHWVFPKQEVLDLARKAVELDERDHRAHCILGAAQIYAGEYDAARLRMLRALELNPNDADVLAHASWALAIMGEHDPAVETGRRALRLAPHHPEWYVAFVGIALFTARLHEEAIATMAPAPEALCNTPAFIAAAYAHLGRPGHGERYKDTVYRHYRRQQARGLFPSGMSCIDWLLAMDPFRQPADAEHFAEGLRRAGFE